MQYVNTAPHPPCRPPPPVEYKPLLLTPAAQSPLTPFAPPQVPQPARLLCARVCSRACVTCVHHVRHMCVCMRERVCLCVCARVRVRACRQAGNRFFTPPAPHSPLASCGAAAVALWRAVRCNHTGASGRGDADTSHRGLYGHFKVQLL